MNEQQLDPIKGYMCTTDYDYELGNAAGGVKVYASKRDALKYCACAKGCGLTEVTITYSKRVLDRDHTGELTMSDIDSKNAEWRRSAKKQLRNLQAHITHYLDQVKVYTNYVKNLKKELAEK